MNEIVAKAMREGYKEDDPSTVLALLVMALGRVAVEGVSGSPISAHNDRPSGFRGGSSDNPPGRDLFNEARRRLGFIATQCTLENVQIMLLQATYYQSTARHLDFWRTTLAASEACQVLIRCHGIHWPSANGDLVKRAHWTCVLFEQLFHIELDLPQSQIHTLEDEIPLPHFQETQDQQKDLTAPVTTGAAAGGERGSYEHHFLAMISLCRLIWRIHREIHACEHNVIHAEPLAQDENATTTHVNTSTSTSQAATSDYHSGPAMALIRELAGQLDSWRTLSTRFLQWSDEDESGFLGSDLTAGESSELLFSAEQGSIPIGHMCSLDIVGAHLKTRFCYARFMVYRPLIYKALHFPELMTMDEYHCCAIAIKSICVWPLAMAPPRYKKRLVPYMWTWSQQFMAILLILNLCTTNECLRRVVGDGLVRPQEIEQTVQLVLDWLRDAKQIDGIAERSWAIVEPLSTNLQ